MHKFQELKSAFEVVGFRDGEVNSIYRVIAGILHLGDIEFGEVTTDDNTDNKSRVIDLAPLHRGKLTSKSHILFKTVHFTIVVPFQNCYYNS